VLVHKNGSVKVVDFGIARRQLERRHAHRNAEGQGRVHAPSSSAASRWTARRRLRLGVVMYELLAGKRPWEGTS